jgi:hypothetical protein
MPPRTRSQLASLETRHLVARLPPELLSRMFEDVVLGDIMYVPRDLLVLARVCRAWKVRIAWHLFVLLC